MLGSAIGCSEPPIDDATPTPKGVIEGSVLYIGPRPLCTYVDGVATEITGRLLLTIADNTKLLPPEGTSSSPTDFLAVGGEDIFALGDCLPEVAGPAELSVVIMKTASFRWTDLPLATEAGATIRYRVSGFYDQEGDFNPLFAVAQTPTRGDMAGAALENAQAANPQFKLVEFGSVVDNPLGQRVTGVAVTMGGFVQTEPPVFYVTDGDIQADAPVESATSITLSLFSRTPDALRNQLDTLLTAVNRANFVDFRDVGVNTLSYAWYVQRFDLNRDGMANETHPTSNGLAPYLSPYIFLQRFQNQVELATGVPTVAIIPSVDDASYRVRYPLLTANIGTRFAAMVVNPAVSACNVVIAADGSFGAFFGAFPAAFECHDLPTGYYGVNALNGVVGGTPGAPMGGATSDTGLDIQNGQFGNQVWRIPNEFGDCTQLNGGPNCNDPSAELPPNAITPLANQGLTGAAIVHDATPTGANGRRETAGQAGVCDGYSLTDFPGGLNGTCCGPVLHLCDIPLCPFVETTPTWSGGTAYNVRSTPTSIVRGSDGVNRPNCMPFPIPQQCCANEVPAAP